MKTSEVSDHPRTEATLSEIELLIDKKVAEAKLTVVENRLNHFIKLATIVGAIFGIFFPLWYSYQASNKVDAAVRRMEEKTAKEFDRYDSLSTTITGRLDTFADRNTKRMDDSIQRMETKFNELSGKQLRTPKLVCFLEGKKLAGSTVILGPKRSRAMIEVRNNGTGTADFLSLTLYVEHDDEDVQAVLNKASFFKQQTNDKPEFQAMYRHGHLPRLPAQDSRIVGLFSDSLPLKKDKTRTRVLLRTYCGEPIPDEFPFTLEIRKAE